MRFIVAIAATALALSSCAADPYHPLFWRPSDRYQTGHLRLKNVDRSPMRHERFKLVLVDERPEPRDRFGENVRTGRTFATRDDIGAWTRDRLAQVLSEYGLPIVTTGETAVIRLHLLKAFVTEANTYNGQIIARFTVQRPNGALVWEREFTSGSRRFGRTHNVENYYQALSRSVLDTAADLLNDDYFFYALRAGSPGAAGMAPVYPAAYPGGYPPPVAPQPLPPPPPPPPPASPAPAPPAP